MKKCLRVTDYRRYHLSGDLEQVIRGKVSNTIGILENTTVTMSQVNEDVDTEQLQQTVAEQKANSSKLQQQVEAMKISNEIATEKMQQEQWELALEELKNTREQMPNNMKKTSQDPSHIT